MEHESYSWMTRLEAWAVMLQVIERNPLLGFGPANYYHYTLLFPILGWWVRFNSHNNYLDILGQTGVLGLLAFFWFAYLAGRLTLRLWSRAPRASCGPTPPARLRG
jgi:O-antigen ligase